MFKIGEFSQLGQVSTRMLRHYDKLGLLTPSRTDDWTGYRYYTIDQLSRLHRIIALRDLGFGLQEIGELLQATDEPSVEQLRGMLALKQSEVKQEIAERTSRLRHIEARLEQIEQEGEPSPYEIVVKSVAAYSVASIRTTVAHAHEVGYYCDVLYDQLYGILKKTRIRPLQPEVTLYHASEYRETDLDVEMAVAVHPKYVANEPLQETVCFREVPGHELMAGLIYEGPLRDVTPAILALIGWIGVHEHVPIGPLREVHLSGPVHAEATIEEECVTELQAPIAPIK
ncbi:MAG: MerR family transcriptional regulator [Chloroflexota bacterium]